MFNVDVNKKNLLEIQNALKDAHYDALIVPHEDDDINVLGGVI